ncbi:conserved hypothetical protein [Ricinus communis]|uniref:DUF8018 domain-containing protein n=1 Tax=Ricinus communis TaxID=3988 RepID=B9TA66_RICCO|nr:conserved hypothetical protein [Ricinus communis]EEF27241.1 conserved hypothetical protein [Ricinus communis]|eukprot:XP_002535190.1 uncharacterized protein LOC8269616 [Ricinus communis]
MFLPIALSLGERALSFGLCKLGFSGGLAFAIIRFGVRALFSGSLEVVCWMDEAPAFPGGSKSTSSLPSPSDPSSESSGGETDSFGIQVLLESYSSKEGESSVNQPPADQVAVPVPEEAARSPHVVPYPYHPDEVIGGDSVSAIERRLLAASPTPTYFELSQARMEAEDLFEVKVEIVRVMLGLHPEGDWMGRGARALDNPRTSTGEQSLEKLTTLLSDLQSGGVHSDSFKELKGKVFLRGDDEDEHSAA